MLAYDPDDRISAREVLKSNYFRDLREQDKKMQSGVYSLHYPVSSVKNESTSPPHREESEDLLEMSLTSKKSMMPTLRNKKHASSFAESPEHAYKRSGYVDNSARTMKKGSGTYHISPSGGGLLDKKSKGGVGLPVSDAAARDQDHDDS